MVFEDLPALCWALVFLTSLMAILLILKVRRDGNSQLAHFSVLDFVVVIVLPLCLSIADPLSSPTVQKLLLSGFLFYLSISAIYLFFSSAATKFLIPFISFFLLFLISILSVRFVYDPQDVNLPLFAYYFSDEVTLSTFTVAFLAAFLPLSRRLSLKIETKLDSRRLGNIATKNVTDRSSSGSSLSDKNPKAIGTSEITSPLRKAMRLFRRKEYRQCIEFCDTELERMMLSRLIALFPSKIDLPMSLQDQLSKLVSKQVSLPDQDILQCRKLRNSLTMSSQEATAQQAKWSIKLLRRTRRTLESSNTTPHCPEDSQRDSINKPFLDQRSA